MPIKTMLELGITNDIYSQAELATMLSTGLDTMVSEGMIDASDKQGLIDLINTKLI